MRTWIISTGRACGSLENHATTVITAAGTSDLLRVKRYRSVHELRWDDSCQVGPVKVRAFEVKHWGARTRTDVHRGYNGYLIEAGRHRIVFGGDTAYTDTFRKVRSSKPVDLAIMPIGAYDPWIHAHCNPEQALAMANQAGAEFVLPVHHQTFKLSSEPLSGTDRAAVAGVGVLGRIASWFGTSAENFIWGSVLGSGRFGDALFRRALSLRLPGDHETRSVDESGSTGYQLSASHEITITDQVAEEVWRTH